MEEFVIKCAAREDLQKILDLQYLAYQTEADLFGTKENVEIIEYGMVLNAEKSKKR